jgi:organic hydroperoxide reductase OsmC/OhrA
MKPLPHQYEVDAITADRGTVELRSPKLPPLISGPPAEFGGSGDVWSPETLLVAAAADCFVLTFKALAATSRLHWSNIVCNARGKLDHAEDGVRFTEIELKTRLEIPADTDLEKARRVLERTEKACLVGNSLKFVPTVHYEVAVEELVRA